MSPVSLPLAFALLIVAGGVLIWEARAGSFTSGSARGDAWRAVLFFAAASVGSALLIRSAGGALLLIAAFAPVTLLSLVRFVALVRLRWAGAASSVVLALALVAGTVATLSALPETGRQGSFLEQILGPERVASPESINPDARRPVRM